MLASLQLDNLLKDNQVLANVGLDTPSGCALIKALIDSGAEKNYISVSYCKVNNLQFGGNMLPPSRFINGETTPCFGCLEIPVTIVDSFDKEETHNLQFDVIDMRGYNMLIG